MQIQKSNSWIKYNKNYYYYYISIENEERRWIGELSIGSEQRNRVIIEEK
jgi:hypothetical protein